MKDSLREATAGAVAGALSKTILAPLDRIKLMIQLQGSLSESQKKDMIASKRLESISTVAKNIYAKEGILALWRGNLPTILIQSGTSAFNFLFMDWYKKLSRDIVTRVYGQSANEDRKTKIALSFVSGGLAGGTCMTLMYPLGLMRTQLALDVGAKDRKYPNGMRDVVTQTWATNGLRGLFQGYGVALFSVTLYRCVYLGGYDAMKAEIARIRRHNDDSTTMSEKFFAAQSVSMLASIAHYPLDSVRRRLMMQSSAKERRYKNAFDCFRQIYVQEGFRGYYLGIGTNLVRSFGAALLLVTYDLVKSLLK
jgi:solute carrier family 25 (adenine nucleotide translocator) protein 4/5/6/31